MLIIIVITMHAHTVMSAPIILNAPSEHASPVHPRKQTQMFGAPHTPFTQSWSHKAAIHAHIHIRESHIAGAFYQASMQNYTHGHCINKYTIQVHSYLLHRCFRSIRQDRSTAGGQCMSLHSDTQDYTQLIKAGRGASLVTKFM